MIYLNFNMDGIACRGILGEEEFLTKVFNHITKNGMVTPDNRQRVKCVNVFATDLMELNKPIFREVQDEYMGVKITKKDIQALMSKGLYAPKSIDENGHKVENALVWIKLRILDERGYVKLGNLCIRREDVSASRKFLVALLKWNRSKVDFCQEIDKLLLTAELSMKGTTKQESTIKLV